MEIKKIKITEAIGNELKKNIAKEHFYSLKKYNEMFFQIDGSLVPSFFVKMLGIKENREAIASWLNVKIPENINKNREQFNIFLINIKNEFQKKITYFILKKESYFKLPSEKYKAIKLFLSHIQAIDNAIENSNESFVVYQDNKPYSLINIPLNAKEFIFYENIVKQFTYNYRSEGLTVSNLIKMFLKAGRDNILSDDIEKMYHHYIDSVNNKKGRYLSIIIKHFLKTLPSLKKINDYNKKDNYQIISQPDNNNNNKIIFDKNRSKITMVQFKKEVESIIIKDSDFSTLEDYINIFLKEYKEKIRKKYHIYQIPYKDIQLKKILQKSIFLKYGINVNFVMYSDDIYSALKENNRFFNRDTNKLCNTLKKINTPATISLSRKIASTKLISSKTKKDFNNCVLIYKSIVAHNILFLTSDILSYPNIIFSVLTYLKKREISEKKIRILFHKVFKIENYIIEDEKGYLSIDNNLIHSIFDVFLYRFIEILKNGSNELIDFIIKYISSFNLTIESINKVSNDIVFINDNIKYINKELLKKIKTTTEIIAFVKKDKAQKEKDKIKYIKTKYGINDNVFNMSFNMLKHNQIINAYNLLESNKQDKKRFDKAPKYKEYVKEYDEYTIGLTNHQNPISMLATGVSGVCIDIYSETKIKQLNPNFFNVVVYNSTKVFLWGLLVEAHCDKNNNYFILNNLQGGFPRKSDKINLKNAINETILEFITNNNIKGLFSKNNCFNSINLTDDWDDEKPDIKFLKLYSKIRVDFMIDSKGFVDNKFINQTKFMKNKN